MNLRAPAIGFVLGALSASIVALQCRPAPGQLGQSIAAIGDTAAAVADREGQKQQAIDSSVAALQAKIRYVDSVHWIAKNYVPSPGDSNSLHYWQARAKSAESLLELAADAGDVDAQVHATFQAAIDSGRASSGRLRRQLYDVRDSLRVKRDKVDALEADLAQARKSLRFGIAANAIAVGDCAMGVAGVTMVARKTLLGIEAEGQATAGVGATACRGGERSAIGPAITLGGRATR